jgi:hypothetical protein
MNTHRSPKLKAIDMWGRRAVYRARIVQSHDAAVLIKPGSRLRVGKRISFVRLSDVTGAGLPDWRSGVIWRIDNSCLHLTRT